jgi:hypothetical protein
MSGTFCQNGIHPLAHDINNIPNNAFSSKITVPTTIPSYCDSKDQNRELTTFHILIITMGNVSWA